jgi:hypothetical protein
MIFLSVREDKSVGKLAIRCIGLIVLFSVFAGCTQIKQTKNTIQMQDQTNAYRKAIRWSEYEVAAAFIRRRDETAYDFDLEFYKSVRVVEMEIQSREVFETEGTAIVTSKIQFYHVDYNSVKTLLDRQTWWFDAELERWFLDGSFPDYAGTLNN